MADNAELAVRFERVLSALRNIIATEAALDPAWEESKKGVEGAFADALFLRSQARRAFEDETPTMDTLIISLKDNHYKDPSWPNDGSNDAQTLRTVWHAVHDIIAAGKRFTADDLTAISNLYSALERARKILTESERRTVTHSGEKFQWKPPMLEGYVLSLLKELEAPTERKAVEWIAAKTGKPQPSRATLRKTFFWQNHLKKTPKPHITTESQSGVSPAQNSDVRISHVDVTIAVLDIEEKLNRQLVDNERDAVEWTLEQAGPNEKEREEAICQLVEGLRSAHM